MIFLLSRETAQEQTADKIASYNQIISPPLIFHQIRSVNVTEPDRPLAAMSWSKTETGTSTWEKIEKPSGSQTHIALSEKFPVQSFWKLEMEDLI